MLLPSSTPGKTVPARRAVCRVTRTNRICRQGLMQHLWSSDVGQFIQQEAIFHYPVARAWAEGYADIVQLDFDPGQLFLLTKTPACLQLCRQMHQTADAVGTEMIWSPHDRRFNFNALVELDHVSARVRQLL